jgi:hypothetical protein
MHSTRKLFLASLILVASSAVANQASEYEKQKAKYRASIQNLGIIRFDSNQRVRNFFVQMSGRFKK